MSVGGRLCSKVEVARDRELEPVIRPEIHLLFNDDPLRACPRRSAAGLQRHGTSRRFVRLKIKLRPLSNRGLDTLHALARLFGYVRYFH